MTPTLPNTLQEAIQYFADPQRCQDLLSAMRWPQGPVCPNCRSHEHGFVKSRAIYQCKMCRKQYSAKVGTIFEDSPIKVDKWFCALWMITNAKNGVSSYEVARSLGVTQKTAWFMMHRIRLALQHGSIDRKLMGEVEVDETYIGGKARNMHHKDVPREYDRATLESFKGIGATLRKHVTHIHISNDDVEIDYTPDMVRRIDRLLGPESIEAGSISGRLDAINVHNNVNKFYLYPAIGPKKVICHFPDSMVNEAIAAIQQNIEVSGTFKYKRRDFFPYEIEVDKLRVFPLVSETPSLMSLRGIAPNATNGLDSVAFVRERRNAVG